MDKISRKLKRKYKFKFDINAILSDLIYARILEPSSKRSSFKTASEFLESPSYELHDIYRALDILGNECDMIQTDIYKNSHFLGSRNDKILYYDCTNYYFEIEQEDGSKKYGKSKEHRPNPIMQMGLFMDGDSISLAFSLFPENANKQTSLKPLEKKVLQDFGCQKFIYCSDAGLASEDIRCYNHMGERAYIVTQSIKKLKKDDKQWALDPHGFKRAQKMLCNGSTKKNRKNPNDPARFIEKTAVTKDGEAAQIKHYLGEDKIMGDYMGTAEGEAAGNIFYDIAFGKDPYYHQRWLSGRITSDDNFTFYEKPDLDKNAAPVPEGDFIVKAEIPMYYVSVDSSGKLGWKSNILHYVDTTAHVIEILTAKASNSYKAFLRKLGISYIIAGKDELDYALAMEKLYDLFDIRTLMLGGGEILNWSFIQTDMCDEISVVIAASADGSSDTPALFSTRNGFGANRAKGFILENAEVKDGGSVWLRYKTKL